MAGVHAMILGSGGSSLYLKPNGVTVAAASESAKGKWQTLGGKNYYVAIDYDDLVSVVSVYKDLTGAGEVLANLTRDGQTFSIPLNQVVTTYIDILSKGGLHGLFYNLYYFNQLLNSWDVSNVTTMYSTFRECRTYNQPLNYWNTSSCTNMAYMFSRCQVFNQDISNWCVSNIPTKPSNFDSVTPTAWNATKQPNWGAPC